MALSHASAGWLTHEEYQRRTYLPELDGLRAISILLVISYHMGDGSWQWLGGPLGVTLFFVLSGYLITRLALAEERNSGSVNIPAFFVRRIFRLFPLYYAVLALYGLLVLRFHLIPDKVGIFREALPFYLFYFQEFVMFHVHVNQHVTAPFAHSWSLGIEEKFYLVWPFLGFVAWRAGGASRLAGTAILAVLAALAPLILGGKVGVFFFPYSQIALGCLVALALDRADWFDGLSWVRQRSVGVICLGILLAIQLAIPHLESRRLPLWYGPYMLSYMLATAFLLVAILLGNPIFVGLLSWPPLDKVGRLSYGIYLIHALIIRGVEKAIPPVTGAWFRSVIALVLVMALSLGVSFLLALTIERPGIALGKRLSSYLQRREKPVQSRPDMDCA